VAAGICNDLITVTEVDEGSVPSLDLCVGFTKDIRDDGACLLGIEGCSWIARTLSPAEVVYWPLSTGRSIGR
jgi:hypothetical protein